jgi:mycothiol synthase
MIKYEWRNRLSPAESAELADLLQRAAAYDAEPEYSSIDFADVEQAMSQADSPVRHLVIWMLPYATAMGERDEPERIAGLLRLVFTSENQGEVTVVIDPRLRSKGIMTLLVEQVGLDTTAPDGWMGTGVGAGQPPCRRPIEQPVPDPAHAPRVEAHQVNRIRRGGHRRTGFGADRRCGAE